MSNAQGGCLAGSAKFLFIATMDVDPEHDQLFNEVYDNEHIPSLLRVTGVRSATRYRKVPGELSIGGAKRPLADEGAPKYQVLYSIDGPEVLTSSAWARAVEAGRWATMVRPHTANRRHLLLERL